ncbi:MAG: class SAM-dependent methyltransferase [Flavipsychrobacter sp.]|jgi:ubiquinone/menaquinone biosynthesis C-methylase UbiE|nr:class SAM-dependent methyltransferase [Flavipsychrobacter sp.]
MPAYLDYKFEDSPAFISTFDEMPLWSAYFGMLLLKHIELKQDLTVLDIGSGAGFPLLELAQRLGNTCTCYGLDPWVNANNRANEKIKNYAVSNVTVIEGSAEKIPFGDASIGLIVSNLGINNFSNPELVFKECARVLKPGGRLALTTNLNGHWQEFYDVFQTVLNETNNTLLIEKLTADQERRGTVASISSLFTDAGLKVTRSYTESFQMRFLDGSAFLNHYFVKLGWLASWKEIVPADKQEGVFIALEKNLNALAAKSGCLTLNVPMAFIEGERA